MSRKTMAFCAMRWSYSLALSVSPDPDKIKALQESLHHPPKNASELQTFPGFAGYYWPFVERFAQTTKPLHQLFTQQSKETTSEDITVPMETHLSGSFWNCAR